MAELNFNGGDQLYSIFGLIPDGGKKDILILKNF